MTDHISASATRDSDAHRPVILQDNDAADRSRMANLRSDPSIEVLDHRISLLRQLESIRPAPEPEEIAEPFRWSYYPWRRTLVSVLGPNAFQRLRLDRNRNKITLTEQARLGRLRIGIVGLSVGHAIAHTLALEGLCGELRLADFDTIELSNLNRIPASIMDLGVNKSVVAARRIAELDPYLKVEIFTSGLDEATVSLFLEGLDLVIEECDSLDTKVRVREEARRQGIPVLMETNDRGLIDVERFDLEPERPLFHGLLGILDSKSLQNLTIRGRAPYVMRILEAPELSARIAASMVEIDRTVSTWPQLGGDVQLGAALIAAAVRRLGRGDNLPSGRIRVDLDDHLDGLGAESPQEFELVTDEAIEDLTLLIPRQPLEAVIHAIRLAPSGGNSQPWTITHTPDCVAIRLAGERTSIMDVRFRGSYVAIGAAGFNARVAAAKHRVLGPMVEFPDGADPDVVMSLALGAGADQALASHYPDMIQRVSNRSFGRRSPVPELLSVELRLAAESEGARLHLVTDTERLEQLAEVLAESDRLRYLTPSLHQQMMSELKWPGRDRLDRGIDVRTLGLDNLDLTKLQIAGRGDVVALLAAWGGGQALGDATRDRVNASSALAVITTDTDTASDYLHGGAAAERVWVCANRNNLGVQPISPVFLYARNELDLHELCADFVPELAVLQHRFEEILALRPGEAPSLVLRLSHDAGPAVRSARLPLAEIMSPDPVSQPEAALR